MEKSRDSIDSIDSIIPPNKEQGYVEGTDDKCPPVSSKSSFDPRVEIKKVNGWLKNPNLSGKNREKLEKRKHDLMLPALKENLKDMRVKNSAGGSLTGSSGSMVGINFEDAQAMLQQLRRFQETMRGDWNNVLNYWQNLQACWVGGQYERFELFFEKLRKTYEECEKQCEEYSQFLEGRIRGSEDAAVILNM